ncbi:peptidoglycan/LPS O-acetylase OafA/YrhL [Ornithinicoccus hortensis]|uniref:Peptidoglycan/LPS O-acetylase OafA/YrhL n=1 Tax=Ornithinicoccus hortensis TaxID=82346 RepID=A0A542YRW5_9MICO|nr:peptidoglycan/LPS O-acetylase OafA/YrhL [Ornithinicoccus hortensis]
MSVDVKVGGAPPATATRSTFRPELHGVRGLAIALVVVFHVFGHGRVSGGIDAFLAVSGFLMTLSLARQVEAGTLTLWGYLARLARRLLPAALMVLATVAVVGYFWTPSSQRAQLLREIRAVALYRENWELVDSQLDYAAAGPGTSPLQHFWSLSVQGQFYLLWFVLVVVATWVGARLLGWQARRSVFVAVALATVASFVFHQGWAAQDQQVAYFHTGSRIWELGLGGLVALLLPGLRLSTAVRIPIGWLGVALLVSCGFFLDGGALFPGPWALWPVGGVLLVLAAGTTGHRWAADRMLQAAPLKFLADISYAWYVWHWPLLIFTLLRTGQESADLRIAAFVVVTSVLLAWGTTRLVEEPFVRGFSRRTAATLVVGVTGVAVVAGGATWALGVVERHRHEALLEASRPSPDHPGAAVLGEGWTGELTPADVVPDVAVAGGDLPEVYGEGDCINTHRDVPSSADPRLCYLGDPDGDQTIMVLGGSHVTQWLPALEILADQHHWRLVLSEKGGCQFIDRPEPGSSDPPQQESCYQYNENLWPLIEDEQPDYVFTIGTTSRPTTGESTPDGFVALWDRLDQLGIPVLGMRDSTRLEESVPECLERTDMDARACGQERTWRMAEQSPILSVPDLPGNVRPMDVSESICAPDWCPAVVGNVMVYRDTSHITATYMRTLAPAVEDELRRVAPELF